MFCLCCVYVGFMLCLCCVYVVFMLCLCCVYVVFMLCLCSTNNLIYPQKEQLTSCMEQAILSDRKDFLNIFLKEVYYGLLS